MRSYILWAQRLVLLEQMQMLLEDRLAFLLQRFQPLATAMIGRQMGIPAESVATTKRVKLAIPDEMNTAINKQAGEDIAQKLVNFIISLDPDPKKRNAQWLLTVSLRQNQPMPMEDLKYAGETLIAFEKAKIAKQVPPQYSDINRFKSLSEINAVLRSGEETTLSADEAEQAEMMQEAEVTYNGPDALVIKPKTQKAACYFGRETDWCTAWGSHTQLGLRQQGRYPTRGSMYGHYANQGPLYIIRTKPDNQLYQYHASSNQFMDTQDRTVGGQQVVNLLKAHPGIIKGVGEENFAQTHLSTLGLRFFSPEALLNVPADRLISGIKTYEDYAALPERLQTASALLSSIALYKPEIAAQIPKERLSPEVAAVLRNQTNRHPPQKESLIRAFRLFPTSEWSERALQTGIESENLSEAELTAISQLTPPEATIDGVAVHQTTPTMYLLNQDNTFGWLQYDVSKLKNYRVPFETDTVIGILNHIGLPPDTDLGVERLLAKQREIFYGNKQYGRLEAVGKLELAYPTGKIINLRGRRMWVDITEHDNTPLVWLWGTKTLYSYAEDQVDPKTAAAVRQFAIKRKFTKVATDGNFGLLNGKTGLVADFTSLLEQLSQVPDAAYINAFRSAGDELGMRLLTTLGRDYAGTLSADEQTKLFTTLHSKEPKFNVGKTDRVYDIEITHGTVWLPSTNPALAKNGVITQANLKKKIMADTVAACQAATAHLRTMQYGWWSVTPVFPLGEQDAAAMTEAREAADRLEQKTNAAKEERRRNPEQYASDLSSRFAAMNAFRRRD